MYGVDTLSLNQNYREYYIDRYGNRHVNFIKIKPVEAKILHKLQYKSKDIEEKNFNFDDIGASGKYNGYSFFYNSEWNSLTINVPHYKLAGVTAVDIIKDVEESIKHYFMITDAEMVPIHLIRIDIKNDYLCSTPEDLIIIKNIMGKTKESFRSYNKEIEQDKYGKYIVKYNSKKINKKDEEYKITRNKFENINIVVNKKNNVNNADGGNETDDESDEDTEDGNYIEYAFYDKGQEIIVKVSEGRADESEIDEYKNIFRSEVRIKNGWLNSNKHDNKEMTKELSTYYNEETCNELYDRLIKDILRTNDFYKIDEAIKIVRKSTYTLSKKQKLEELLKNVNKYGYTAAENIVKNSYSKGTFYNYLHDIEKLGLNIITFDKCIDGVKIKSKKIPNFGQRKYGVQEI